MFVPQARRQTAAEPVESLISSERLMAGVIDEGQEINGGWLDFFTVGGSATKRGLAFSASESTSGGGAILRMTSL